jgi:putative heme-binding domain-containing protein
MKGRNFENGRKMFGAAACFACHRFGNEGGAMGPDLTSVGGRFGVRDILESIIEPSKEVSDQYAPVVITLTDGRTVTGRIVNLGGDSYRVNTNMFDPDELESVDAKKVKSIEPSKVSMMPEGLVNMLKQDEILDLLAYLVSGGDPKHAAFQ